MSDGVSSDSRRSFLRQMVSGVIAVSALSLLGQNPAVAFQREEAKRVEAPPKLDDSKTIDKYVNSLKYDEELYENPDPAEREIYRTKRVEKQPDYVKIEKNILKKEEDVLKNELQEAEREKAILQEEFSKRTPK